MNNANALISEMSNVSMESQFSVSEKVALVTGGASGIGFATIKEFLKHGLRGAAIVDVDEENGKKALEELAKEFGPDRVIFVKTDVSNGQEVEAAFEKVITSFQNLDVVINAAGICRGDEWEKEVAVNLVGTIHSTLLGFEKYLPKYKCGDEAVIVNVSSIGGLEGIESYPTYCGTKHGVVGLSTSLGTKNHYKRTKVRMLVVCPSATETSILQKMTYLSPVYEELCAGVRSQLPFQSAEKVAEGVMKVIREGSNSSIWIVHDGETYEVKMPSLFTLLKK